VSSLRFQYLRSMKDVSAAAWDALRPAHVFTSHTWLSALEVGGLVAPGGSVEYRIPALFDAAGTLVAAAPGVVKRKALAEYGPENLWIQEAARQGANLLPKMQLEVPFVAAPSPKFLVHPAAPHDQLASLLLKAVTETTAASHFSTLTVARMAGHDEAIAAAHGMLSSAEIGSRWTNEEYGSFGAFLTQMKSDYRYSIRRERSEFRELGHTVRELRGKDIRPHHWDAFLAGHEAVCRKYQAPAFLNRKFLDALHPLGDAIWLIAVFSGDTYRAGSFMVQSGDTLFSRSWSQLHVTPGALFEAGSYRPMEIAIELGLKFVDCGVWGPHKPERGFEAIRVPNAHWFRDTAVHQLAVRINDRHQAAVSARFPVPWKEHYMRSAGVAP
jgi:predicted N-acyltransferase